jgi:L-alanine-DL-glutamate epimerase-like enolase superfamily enzyme
MSSIVDVEAIGLECPVDDWFLPTRTYVLVRITTSDGITGIGQCGTVGHPEVAAIVNARMRPLLIGQDPLARPSIWKMLATDPRVVLSWGHKGAESYALSGIDIALWDIAGKMAGRPIHELLGKSRDRIPAYASHGNPERAAHYAAQGFTSYKFGEWHGEVGDLASIERDLVQIREAIGSDAKLLFDGFQRYDLHTAARVSRLLDEYDVFFFEEPILSFDFDGMAKLASTSPVPLAAGEHQFTVREAADLILHGGVQFVQPEITNCGGITEAMKIAAVAESRGCKLCPHCGDSPVGLAAMLQVVASAPNAIYGEWQAELSYPMRWELLAEPIRVGADGFIDIPTGPGLGIELDPDAVEKYRWER